MYRPPKYHKDDKEFIFSFIQKYPFASFILNGKRLLATHIPVLVEGDAEYFRLYSHIAKHNEMNEFLAEDSEGLLIFHGPHAYISSSWYQEKDISTWDYTAVHINVKINLQSREELETSLNKLVEKFEKDQGKPLYYNDIPEEMLQTHLPQITGFWMNPTKIEGIAKLHQKYSNENINAVVEQLEKSDDSSERELGDMIRKENHTE